MTLYFPNVPEVRLVHPPLVEVVCQVRYPPILVIIKEEPIAFQEKIRHRFPGFGIEQPFKLQVPRLGGASEPAAEVSPRLFRFKTMDELTATSLAVDFYALQTTGYSHWTDFVNDLAVLHQAVTNMYQPAYATRIGLRYINRFSRSNTGLATVEEIYELIKPELTAQLRSDAWSDPEEWLSHLVLPDGEGKLSIRTALDSEQNEPALMLDFDYYEQGRLELDGVLSRVNRYHDVIYRAFRWSVLDKGLQRFDQVKVD